MGKFRKKLIAVAFILLLAGCASREPSWFNVATMYHWQEQTADALHECRKEKEAARIVAACPHQWEALGPGRKGCPVCGSIADNICGTWKVVLAGGKWIGPPPCKEYPKCCGQLN